MASSGSHPIALDADIVEKFAARAKRLGTTQDKEISRALREWLATREPVAVDENKPSGAEAVSLHLVEEHGFLLLVGDVPADAIPDHRELREERLDDVLRRSLGESGI